MRALRILVVMGLFVVAAGCQESTGGLVGDVCLNAGWVCSTPTCQMFPTNPSCVVTFPVGGYCPIAYARCWDPTGAPDYCDPRYGVCAADRSPPVGCSAASVCSLGDVERCYEVPRPRTLFCNGQLGLRCRSIVCPDGGVPADGAARD